MPRQTLKQRKDGRYKCVYKGVQFYGATQSEALAARAAYIRDEEQQLKHTQPTVREYATSWLPIHRANVSSKTYNDYAKQVDALIAKIGDKYLRAVTPTDIKSVYMHYVGYSDSTIKRARILYKGIFRSAVADGYIHVNPCDDVQAQPHKGTVGTHRAISEAERKAIHGTIHRLRPAVMVMLYAGLRRGEAMALNIDRDVDFAKKVIHVREAVRFESNQPILTSPKTEAGEREIPMIDILASELRGKHGLLLPSANGTLCSDTAFRRAWDSYLRAIGTIPGAEAPIRPHDLRHSYCTMLRDAGVDLKIAMQWMGHADKDMILKIYDHITPKRVETSVSHLNDFMIKNQV